MKYIETDYLDSILMNALEELINKCNGYEPYYCESHNDSFIQCALVDENADSPVMYGFVGLLINDECGYVEVSGLVAPDFRHMGHFRKMLSICNDVLKNSPAGNLSLVAPVSGDFTRSSLCGELCFNEYLYKLDKSQLNLSAIHNNEPANAEYYLEGEDYLMYLPEYDEPVALLYLDAQNTFVNIYGVFVDENLRGKGIGTCLMKHFLKDYFNVASLPLVLNVTSNNKAAVALYKKCGFAEASRIEYHYINCSDN